MNVNQKIELFKRTDTTLVYLASIDYTKELLNSHYKSGDRVYIHINRDTGFMIAYNNQDCNRVVPIDMSEQEDILKFCENMR